jgi:hypothetical protein
VSWTSPWQPARIPTSDGWWPTSFSDVIPEDVLTLDNLSVDILLAPFPPDRLFMRPKAAQNDSVFVREATFSILPPLALPPEGQRNWLFY